MTTSARSAGRELTHPTVAGGAYRVVDSERRCRASAVDRVDSGDARGAGRLGDVGEQQADRALADDGDVPPGQFGQLLAGIQDARERLQADRLGRGQRRIVGREPVPVADHALHHAVEPGGPADHTVAGAVVGVPAGEHLAGDFVDGKAVFFGSTRSVVSGEAAPGPAKGRQVAAADARGQKPQQHLAVGETLGRPVRDRRPLEQVGGDDPVGPHVIPPPGSCCIPIGSWTAAAWRPRRGSRSRAPGAAIPVAAQRLPAGPDGSRCRSVGRGRRPANA